MRFLGKTHCPSSSVDAIPRQHARIREKTPRQWQGHPSNHARAHHPPQNSGLLTSHGERRNRPLLSAWGLRLTHINIAAFSHFGSQTGIFDQTLLLDSKGYGPQQHACEHMDARREMYNTNFHATRAYVRFFSFFIFPFFFFSVFSFSLFFTASSPLPPVDHHHCHHISTKTS